MQAVSKRVSRTFVKGRRYLSPVKISTLTLLPSRNQNLKKNFTVLFHLNTMIPRYAIRRSAVKSASGLGRRHAHKEVKFSNEGRAAMLAGVDILAKAVSVTLGPKGACRASRALASENLTSLSLTRLVPC